VIASPVRMRDRVRKSLACLLTLALSTPLVSAQQAAPAAAAPSLVGGWVGWAKLTNDWPGLGCHYETNADAETVHLALSADSGRLRGSLAIDIPAAAGSGCPPLRKRYAIEDVAEAAGSVSFTDSGGNEWTLALRRQGEVLQGLVAWRTGGPDQPLADGFTSANGQRPLSRLSGEVRLHRNAAEPEAKPGAPATAGGGASAASAPRKTSAGTIGKYVAIVLGANAVGLGFVYAANRLGKGSASGTTTCSPRLCNVGLANQPCSCRQPDQDSGADCKNTGTGVPDGEACDGTVVPCQNGHSCNILPGATAGVCEDKLTGHCR
jgi:hypothetical protein